MHSIDIDLRDENYVVVFEMPDIVEENIVITAEDKTLHVVALNHKVTKEIRNNDIKIDAKTIVYDKTAILENPDFSKMKHVFFLGWLEVTVPKKSV